MASRSRGNAANPEKPATAPAAALVLMKSRLVLFMVRVALPQGLRSACTMLASLPEACQRGEIHVFLRCTLDRTQDFSRSRSGGQRHAQLIGEIERQAHVLVHEAKRKARLVFPLQHHP